MADLPESRRDAVESFVAEWVSDDRIPGASLAVVDRDGIRYAEGFGARTLDGNVPATPDTLFGIGSCTKSVTAMAVMQLVERGDLSVSDPVADYLPYLADAPGDPITVRELLTHTSGMPADGSGGPLITRAMGGGHAEVPLSSRADFRRHVRGSLDRRVTDRETFYYYNSGYTMLSQVVEAVTDRAFAAYVEEEVLAPLGMERSTFSREAFGAEDDRMTPYHKEEGEAVESGFPFDPLIHGPGGLVSSAREMADYLRAYLGDGAADRERVVSPGSLDEMTTPEGAFGTYFDGREMGYGYGLMVEEFLDDTMVGHGGSVGVSSAWFGYLDDAGLGVALLCTTGPRVHPMVAGRAVLAILRDEDSHEVVPQLRLTRTLETVTGEYSTYRDIGSATVERVGGSLRFEASFGFGGQELLFTPVSVEDGLLTCSTTMVDGLRREARFEIGDGVTLFFERDRYEKDG